MLPSRHARSKPTKRAQNVDLSLTKRFYFLVKAKTQDEDECLTVRVPFIVDSSLV